VYDRDSRFEKSKKPESESRQLPEMASAELRVPDWRVWFQPANLELSPSLHIREFETFGNFAALEDGRRCCLIPKANGRRKSSGGKFRRIPQSIALSGLAILFCRIFVLT